MAADWVMLAAAATAHAAMVRVYGWREPAATFGYTQRWAEVAPLAVGWDVAALIRRPSAGGLVDHRDDWTYALAVPRGWPLAEAASARIYAVVHAALAKALRRCGVPAALAGQVEGDPLQCFVAPVRDDLIDPESGQKLAGAALKRSREGLLLQGSLRGTSARAAGPERLREALVQGLSACLGCRVTPTAWQPEKAPEWRDRRTQLASEEWHRRR